jgi:hypothetical protein
MARSISVESRTGAAVSLTAKAGATDSSERKCNTELGLSGSKSRETRPAAPFQGLPCWPPYWPHAAASA